MTSAQEGFWSPITSSVAWCEEDYVFTRYIAEFHNCWSNIAMVGLSLYGFVKSRRDGLPLRISIGHLMLTLVGLGSISFHATLKRTTQLLDELPMLLSAAYYNWMLLSSFWPAQRNRLGVAILLMASASVALYLFCDIFELFVATYGLGQTFVLIELLIATRGQNRTHQIARSLTYRGHVLVLLAVIPWYVDNEACAQLQTIWASVGPFAVLFEAHAWWHILTGIGAHLIYTAAVIVDLDGHGQAIEVEDWRGIAWRVRKVEETGVKEEEKETVKMKTRRQTKRSFGSISSMMDVMDN